MGGPVPVHRGNRHVPRDLAIVLEKALDREPQRRYPTALELAEDLARVRQFEPIRARPVGPVLRARRWMRRNPVTTTVLALLAFGLLVMGAIDLVRQALTPEPRLVFWNTLGSDAELGSSVIGPPVTRRQTPARLKAAS